MNTRSSARVKELGEVFTPPKIVNEMIDLVMKDKDMADDGITFFEPSCGNGNFVMELVSRRLKALYQRYREEGKDFIELRACVEAVQSVWAIDIDQLNIIETRSRVYGLIKDFLSIYLNDYEVRVYMAFMAKIISDRIFQNEALTAMSKDQHDAFKTSQTTTKTTKKWYEERGWLPMPFFFGR